MPDDVHEEPGQGIEGRVDGHRVAVGSRAFARNIGVPAEEIVAAASTHDEDQERRTSSSRSTATSPG